MRKGTYHHTLEARAKMSAARKGKPSPKGMLGKTVSLITRAKIRKARLGKVVSDETREKLRQANLGKISSLQGIPRSLEIREKIRKSLLGHLVFDETREKMRRANLGKHLSEETKEKIRQAHLGEKCYNWQGGISFEEYSTAWTEALKEAIRKRDQHTCQLCGRPQVEFKKKLDIHHIDYDKKNLDTENLISLCHRCHMKTNYNRAEWIRFFNE